MTLTFRVPEKKAELERLADALNKLPPIEVVELFPHAKVLNALLVQKIKEADGEEIYKILVNFWGEEKLLIELKLNTLIKVRVWISLDQ